MPTKNRIRIDRLWRIAYAQNEVQRAVFNALLKDESSTRGTLEKVAQRIREVPDEERVDRKAIRRYCIISNFPRSVNKSFGLSRHFLKNYGMIGLVPGLNKKYGPEDKSGRNNGRESENPPKPDRKFPPNRNL